MLTNVWEMLADLTPSVSTLRAVTTVVARKDSLVIPS